MLIIKELKNKKGRTDRIKIIKQTDRGSEFGKDDDHFIYKNFVLVSANYPEILNGKDGRLKDYGRRIKYGLFVRGNRTNKDKLELLIPSQEWLEKMREAVKVYNKKFNSCEKCDYRHCNDCVINKN